MMASLDGHPQAERLRRMSVVRTFGPDADPGAETIKPGFYTTLMYESAFVPLPRGNRAEQFRVSIQDGVCRPDCFRSTGCSSADAATARQIRHVFPG